jgi:putative membrane protein
MFIMIIFLIALVAGLYFLFKERPGDLDDGERQMAQLENPLDILKKRYARGEIDKEEFEQKKKDLGY